MLLYNTLYATKYFEVNPLEPMTFVDGASYSDSDMSNTNLIEQIDNILSELNQANHRIEAYQEKIDILKQHTKAKLAELKLEKS
jgi:hypothetical protein